MLGPRASVRGAFGSSLSEIGERDVPTDLGLAENLHVKGFLEDAFGTALAHDRPLLSRTRRTSTTLIADPHARDKTLLDPVFQAVGKLSGMVTGLFAPITDEHPEPAKVSWAEAVRVSIVQKQGETWAVLDPRYGYGRRERVRSRQISSIISTMCSPSKPGFVGRRSSSAFDPMLAI